MKKIFAVVFTLFITLATGAQIADGLIIKLLNFSVKEILVEKVFDEVWKSSKPWYMQPSGHQLYHSGRSATYESLGLECDDWESYLQARTIVVARIKSYFFDGQKLKDTYLAVQPKFKMNFQKLSDKEKSCLRQSLSDAKTCFELMLKKENQAVYEKWLEGPDLSEGEISQAWLVNNLSAEEIAKRVKLGELKTRSDEFEIEEIAFKKYPDKDIAKFAGRRWTEGGDDLLRKYVEVIDLAIADSK